MFKRKTDDVDEEIYSNTNFINKYLKAKSGYSILN